MDIEKSAPKENFGPLKFNQLSQEQIEALKNGEDVAVKITVPKDISQDRVFDKYKQGIRIPASQNAWEGDEKFDVIVVSVATSGNFGDESPNSYDCSVTVRKAPTT